jgi:hypothetical protein
MITAGVRLKRLMECLAACYTSESKHGDSITSVSIDFMALQLISITLCVHKVTLNVTVRMPLKCESGVDVHKTYILSMLTTSAQISVLHHLSFFCVHGFHPQGVLPIRPEVEGRLCLCLNDRLASYLGPLLLKVRPLLGLNPSYRKKTRNGRS